jgi:hypothetical protein
MTTRLMGMNVSPPIYYNGVRQMANLALASGVQGPSANLPTSSFNLADGSFTIPTTGYYGLLWAENTGARIRCRYAGTATIALSAGMGVNITTGNDGTYNYFDFDRDPAQTGNIIYNFGVGTVTFLDFREVTLPISTLFHAPYVTASARWGCLRFMDWSYTNGTTALNFTDAFRPKPNSFVQTGPWGLSYETAIELCRAADTDAWINVPWHADQTYVDGLVTYANSRLNAGRVCKIEKSNEVWNNDFTVFGTANSEWLAGGGADLKQPGNTYAQQVVNHNQMCGWIEAKAATLGATVGKTGRFQRRLNVQMGGGPNMDTLLSRPNILSHLDAGAVAPYYGNVYNEVPTAHDLPTMFERMGSSPSNGVDALVATLLAMKTQFATYGLEMDGYETGTHIINTPNQAAHDILYDAGFQKIHSYYLREINSAIPNFPRNNYQDFGPISSFGSWGAQADLTDTASPRLLALLDAQQGIYSVPALAITGTPPLAIQGQIFSHKIHAIWGAGSLVAKTYSLSPIPAGLSLNSTTGEITGSFTNSASTVCTATVTDTSGTATKQITLSAAPPEPYAYTDDARATGSLPATGAGASRMATRGWSQDYGYASGGAVYFDQPQTPGKAFFGAGFNSLDRKVLWEFDSSTWTAQYDIAQLDLVADEGNGKRITLTYQASDSSFSLGKNGSYFANIGKTGTRGLLGVEVTIAAGVVTMAVNGNVFGDPAGYAVGTDYTPTQRIAYSPNNIAYSKPVYRRMALRVPGAAPVAPPLPPSPPPPSPPSSPPPSQQGTGVTTIPIYGGPLKRDIIKSAYGATGQSDTEFELTAEEYTQGLRLMNMVLARWAGQWGVDLGYNFPPPGSLGSADEESGIPFAAEDVVVQTLARQIAPNIGKTMGADAARNYAEAMLALRSTYAKIPPMQMQSDTPRGAGSRRCRWFGPFFSTNRPDDEIIQ